MKIHFLLAALLLALAGCASGNATLRSELGRAPEVLFCPEDNCADRLVKLVLGAQESVHCAFYSLELEELVTALDEQAKRLDVALVLDGKHADKALELGSKLKITSSHGPGLMHNKFCIIDRETVATGSFNPTRSDAKINANNLLVLHSQAIAANYEEEFAELAAGRFGGGRRTAQPSVLFNGKLIESYFCPEDWCANRIGSAISGANRTIRFVTFSFTLDALGEALLDAASRGVDVAGLFDDSQLSEWSEYWKLARTGLNVSVWEGPALLHHKFFVIDNEIVITGSFNPTKAGESSNDENLLVLHNPELAARFVEEFEKLRAKTKISSSSLS